MLRASNWAVPLFLIVAILLPVCSARATDPYTTYILTSPDFQPVKQDKAWEYAAFPSWKYMPWPYQWNTPFTAATGQWAVAHGYNGFTVLGQDTSALDMINANGMGFYVDHAGGKGDLFLRNPTKADLTGTGMRTDQVTTNGVTSPVVNPINATMVSRIEGILNTRINLVKSSPNRMAYDLDDETSWGSYIKPCMWQITDDASAYPNWLNSIYGSGLAPTRTKWYSYNDIRGSLPSWSIKNFDASPLMDQWTFNDSYYLNTIGTLVNYANSVDPATPVGLTGCQMPDAFGGYDYAKLMKKVQFIEAYDIGGSNSIVRSFNPQGAIPSVLTHFYTNANNAIWRTGYYLAHGNRGQIGWVESDFGTGNSQNWFNGTTPATWHDTVAPTYLQANNKIGPLLAQATWKDDGVAILYNQASIQMAWIMDAQAHGSTWVNRNSGDNTLSTSGLDRQAWENMLRDSGIQYNYISYDNVVANGIDNSHYKVLILPETLCLSDAEAAQVRTFVANGGTVVADYMPGLWDQHGKGRSSGGALDDVFGVAQSTSITAASVFQGNGLWSETNQDANFSYSNYTTLLTNSNSSIKDASGFDKAVRTGATQVSHVYGQGKAVLMNLSPQWYNAYRANGITDAAKRSVFINPILSAGVKPWVTVENENSDTFGYEITYFTKDTKTILNLVQNPETLTSGTAVDFRTGTVPITLRFLQSIQHLYNEDTGVDLGSGDVFTMNWDRITMITLSFTQQSHMGDANSDNKVDVVDLGALAKNYDMAGMHWDQGDFNGDGVVDVVDLGALAKNYDWASGSSAIPEPMSLLLLVTGGCAVLSRRRR